MLLNQFLDFLFIHLHQPLTFRVDVIIFFVSNRAKMFYFLIYHSLRNFLKQLTGPECLRKNPLSASMMLWCPRSDPNQRTSFAFPNCTICQWSELDQLHGELGFDLQYVVGSTWMHHQPYRSLVTQFQRPECANHLWCFHAPSGRNYNHWTLNILPVSLARLWRVAARPLPLLIVRFHCPSVQGLLALLPAVLWVFECASEPFVWASNIRHPFDPRSLSSAPRTSSFFHWMLFHF